MYCLRSFFLALFLMLFFPFIGLEAKQKLCLNMIVKNEKEVIERCLKSVRPIIDYWVIVDTGSTDGTQEFIKEYMKDIPGELHERPWKNFGFNRTEALELARDKGDYLLFVDADDRLAFSAGYSLPELSKDGYYLTIHYGLMCYDRLQIVKSSLPWHWEGVLHEYLSCSSPVSLDHIEELSYVVEGGGGRSKDPEKYLKDAQILEEALKDQPSNSRNVFYLAQSYRDAGMGEKAIEWYEKCISMGEWDEEIFCSMLEIAEIKRALGMPLDDVINAYFRAHRFRPSRSEPLYYLSELFNQNDQHAIAYECLKGWEFLSKPPKKDALFNIEGIEKYGLLFQLSISAYYVGHYQESLDACNALLEMKDLPERLRSQVEANRKFSLEKLSSKIQAQPTITASLSLDESEIQSVPLPGEKTVLVSVVIHNNEELLPAFLQSLEDLDYNKRLMTLVFYNYNRNEHLSEKMQKWIEENKKAYGRVLLYSGDSELFSNTSSSWNPQREQLLGKLRNESLKQTKSYQLDFCFMIDSETFISPAVLKDLIEKDKPVVAPLLHPIPVLNDPFRNFFADVTENGYFKMHPDYYPIANGEKVGTFKVPCVHTVYLIKSEFLDALNYEEPGSCDYDFVIFARSARKNHVDQYICNEKEYGTYLHFDKEMTDEERKSAYEKILRSSQWLGTPTLHDLDAAFNQCKNDLYAVGESATKSSFQRYRNGVELFHKKDPTDLQCYFKKVEDRRERCPIKNIDFVYLINLDQRPEKWQASLAQLSPHGISPCRFPAVYGWDLSPEVLNQVGLKVLPGMELGQWACRFSSESPGKSELEFLKEESYGKHYFSHWMTPGAIGCTLSHLSVLQDAYDAGYETIWVLEDDIAVQGNPLELATLIRKLDDLVGKEKWDILYTDLDIADKAAYKSQENNFEKGLKGLCSLWLWRPDMGPVDVSSYEKRKVISDDFVKIGSRMRTHSMIVRRSGMKKILDFEKSHHLFVPYDHELALVDNIQMYSLRYPLVTFLEATSDTKRKVFP